MLAAVLVLLSLASVSAQSTAFTAIDADPDLTTLASLIRAAGRDPFVRQLNDPTLVATFFAPTNKGISDDARAIKSAIGLSPENLPNNVPDIVTILKQHVIVGQAYSGAQLKNGLVFTSALGQKLEIETGYIYGTYVKGPKNRVKILDKSDTLAGRTYIHKVDGVILPKI